MIKSLEKIGVQFDRGTRPAKVRVQDVHDAISREYRNKISTIVGGVGSGDYMVPIYNLLNLRFLNQYSPKQALRFYPVPITATQLQEFLRGRSYERKGEQIRIKSVFEREKFDELGEMSDTVNSHAFRHLLNTIMQESDQFSQEDIAKNFLRKHVGDNEHYNHQIEMKDYRERTLHLQQKVLGKINVTAETAKEAVRAFPTLSHEELESDLEDMGSYHLMNIGRCRHDYSQEPCGRHYTCLRGCNKYKRKKGEQGEVKEITIIRDRAMKQMDDAFKGLEEEFYGANNWYKSHQKLVDGCNAALEIENNPSYLAGELVQIFPDGIDHCEEYPDE